MRSLDDMQLDSEPTVEHVVQIIPIVKPSLRRLAESYGRVFFQSENCD